MQRGENNEVTGEGGQSGLSQVDMWEQLPSNRIINTHGKVSVSVIEEFSQADV